MQVQKVDHILKYMKVWDIRKKTILFKSASETSNVKSMECQNRSVYLTCLDNTTILKIDHLAIGTEKIISFSVNKKFITLTIQGHTQCPKIVTNTWLLDITRIEYQRIPKILFFII